MLAVEEIRLLRSVVEWRRQNGWMFGFYPTRGEAAWKSDRWLVEADIYPDSVRLSVDDETSRRLSLQPSSVVEAVDVLCALEVLPHEFSSAYRAGRESAYTEDEWRVCSGPANKQLPEEFQFSYIFSDELESVEEAVEDLAQARDHWRSEDSWIEHRRTGSTDWERVDDVLRVGLGEGEEA